MASQEVQSRQRPLWPKGTVRASPQGTPGVTPAGRRKCWPPTPCCWPRQPQGAAALAPSHTRKHGPGSRVHRHSAGRQGHGEGGKCASARKVKTKASSALLRAGSPVFSQRTLRWRKRGSVSEFTLAIFPGWNPNRENAPASVCLCRNSQAPSHLKSLHLLLVT